MKLEVDLNNRINTLIGNFVSSRVNRFFPKEDYNDRVNVSNRIIDILNRLSVKSRIPFVSNASFLEGLSEEDFSRWCIKEISKALIEDIAARRISPDDVNLVAPIFAIDTGAIAYKDVSKPVAVTPAPSQKVQNIPTVPGSTPTIVPGADDFNAWNELNDVIRRKALLILKEKGIIEIYDGGKVSINYDRLKTLCEAGNENQLIELKKQINSYLLQGFFEEDIKFELSKILLAHSMAGAIIMSEGDQDRILALVNKSIVDKKIDDKELEEVVKAILRENNISISEGEINTLIKSLSEFSVLETSFAYVLEGNDLVDIQPESVELSILSTNASYILPVIGGATPEESRIQKYLNDHHLLEIKSVVASPTNDTELPSPVITVNEEELWQEIQRNEYLRQEILPVLIIKSKVSQDLKAFIDSNLSIRSLNLNQSQRDFITLYLSQNVSDLLVEARNNPIKYPDIRQALEQRIKAFFEDESFNHNLGLKSLAEAIVTNNNLVVDASAAVYNGYTALVGEFAVKERFNPIIKDFFENNDEIKALNLSVEQRNLVASLLSRDLQPLLVDASLNPGAYTDIQKTLQQYISSYLQGINDPSLAPLAQLVVNNPAVVTNLSGRLFEVGTDSDSIRERFDQRVRTFLNSDEAILSLKLSEAQKDLLRSMLSRDLDPLIIDISSHPDAYTDVRKTLQEYLTTYIQGISDSSLLPVVTLFNSNPELTNNLSQVAYYASTNSSLDRWTLPITSINLAGVVSTYYWINAPTSLNRSASGGVGSPSSISSGNIYTIHHARNRHVISSSVSATLNAALSMVGIAGIPSQTVSVSGSIGSGGGAFAVGIPAVGSQLNANTGATGQINPASSNSVYTTVTNSTGLSSIRHIRGTRVQASLSMSTVSNGVTPSRVNLNFGGPHITAGPSVNVIPGSAAVAAGIPLTSSSAPTTTNYNAGNQAFNFQRTPGTFGTSMNAGASPVPLFSPLGKDIKLWRYGAKMQAVIERQTKGRLYRHPIGYFNASFKQFLVSSTKDLRSDMPILATLSSLSGKSNKGNLKLLKPPIFNQWLKEEVRTRSKILIFSKLGLYTRVLVYEDPLNPKKNKYVLLPKYRVWAYTSIDNLLHRISLVQIGKSKPFNSLDRKKRLRRRHAFTTAFELLVTVAAASIGGILGFILGPIIRPLERLIRDLRASNSVLGRAVDRVATGLESVAKWVRLSKNMISALWRGGLHGLGLGILGYAVSGNPIVGIILGGAGFSAEFLHNIVNANYLMKGKEMTFLEFLRYNNAPEWMMKLGRTFNISSNLKGVIEAKRNLALLKGIRGGLWGGVLGFAIGGPFGAIIGSTAGFGLEFGARYLELLNKEQWGIIENNIYLKEQMGVNIDKLAGTNTYGKMLHAIKSNHLGMVGVGAGIGAAIGIALGLPLWGIAATAVAGGAGVWGILKLLDKVPGSGLLGEVVSRGFGLVGVGMTASDAMMYLSSAFNGGFHVLNLVAGYALTVATVVGTALAIGVTFFTGGLDLAAVALVSAIVLGVSAAIDGLYLLADHFIKQATGNTIFHWFMQGWNWGPGRVLGWVGDRIGDGLRDLFGGAAKPVELLMGALDMLASLISLLMKTKGNMAEWGGAITMFVIGASLTLNTLGASGAIPSILNVSSAHAAGSTGGPPGGCTGPSCVPSGGPTGNLSCDGPALYNGENIYNQYGSWYNSATDNRLLDFTYPESTSQIPYSAVCYDPGNLGLCGPGYWCVQYAGKSAGAEVTVPQDGGGYHNDGDTLTAQGGATYTWDKLWDNLSDGSTFTLNNLKSGDILHWSEGGGEYHTDILTGIQGNSDGTYLFQTLDGAWFIDNLGYSFPGDSFLVKRAFIVSNAGVINGGVDPNSAIYSGAGATLLDVWRYNKPASCNSSQ